MKDEDRDSHHLLFYWEAFSSFMSSLGEAAVPHPCWRSKDNSSLRKGQSHEHLHSSEQGQKQDRQFPFQQSPTVHHLWKPQRILLLHSHSISQHTKTRGVAVQGSCSAGLSCFMNLFFSADKEEDSTHLYFFYCLFIRASKFSSLSLHQPDKCWEKKKRKNHKGCPTELTDKKHHLKRNKNV